MPLTPITAPAAARLLEQGALLVDIRGVDEYRRRHIAQARHTPLEQLLEAPGALHDAAPVVIFHCRSGQRTQANGAALQACVSGQAYRLEGGLEAWQQAGLPLVTDSSRPLELMRQVQIAAGSLVVLGTLLGVTLSPWFLGLTGMVGAGLLFAGVSGLCGLARLLQAMPWNRRAQRAPA